MRCLYPRPTHGSLDVNSVYPGDFSWCIRVPEDDSGNRSDVQQKEIGFGGWGGGEVIEWVSEVHFLVFLHRKAYIPWYHIVHNFINSAASLLFSSALLSFPPLPSTPLSPPLNLPSLCLQCPLESRTTHNAPRTHPE